MIKFSYEEILRKVIEKTGLPKEEIEEKVKDKVKQLSDLVSKEGAAHIVANQYGVKLFENLGNRLLKIKEISKGASSINILCRVINLYGVNRFNKNGKEGRVASLVVADESGSVRVAVWEDSLVDMVENDKFKEGDILKIKNAYSKENNGFTELHLGSRSGIEINPQGETIGDVNLNIKANPVTEHKKISELTTGDNSEILGVIVQLFEPRFYNACPVCNRKPEIDEENGFKCKEHGIVSIKKACILNFFFDDGFGNIRVVCFQDQIKQLLDKETLSEEELSNFDELKNNLLGKQLVIKGRTVDNKMFGRLEFIARSVTVADPVKLLKNDV